MFRKISICIVLCTSIVAFAAEKADLQDFPYIAKVMGHGVYVRSGSATQYYFTMQLDAPAEVTVVDKRFSWCKILPPKDSFSWIAKEFVMIDAENPGYGIVTNDNVRVWAGKLGLDPEDSTSPQGKLNKGEKVKLLGEESGDYYKIAPPKDAYLWINGEYLKFVRKLENKPSPVKKVTKPVEQVKPAVEAVKKDVKITEQATEQITNVEKTAVKTTTQVKTTTVVHKTTVKPVATQYEIDKTKKVYDLIKAVDAERAKAIDVQDYSELKKQIQAIKDDKKAGKATKYARYQLERIAGYELAKEANIELAQQDSVLMRIRQEIAERRRQLLSDTKITNGFAAEGIFKKSLVYDAKTGEQRYLIVDDQGRIICYAIPATDVDIDSFIGKKVGITGNVSADVASGIGLVKFVNIELLEE